MAKLERQSSSISFPDFPEDVQLCVLSFLAPSDISAFACTSKRCVSLCRNDARLWFAMCDRRWGSKTDIRRWGKGKISYKLLYNTLADWENLIGFWRRSGGSAATGTVPPLIFFEWGQHFVAGSRVSPSRNGTYDVIKAPFLWLSLSPEGQVANFLDPDGRSGVSGDLAVSELFDCCCSESELVPVSVSFMGNTHFVVEEDLSFNYKKSNGFRRSSSSVNLRGADEDSFEPKFGSPESLPDRFMSEIYQYFANRTSPVGERSSRRQRRREKERQARRRKWDPQHFVKIVNCSPTPARPFQGIWKGIHDDMNLGFYLIAYDDIGCITCRKLFYTSENFSSYGQLFWISDTTYKESPFSAEEEILYDTRVHLQPLPNPDCILESLSLSENSTVSRIFYLNSSFSLVVPYLDRNNAANSLNLEGRIWQYEDGTFGFGFLRDNFIIDLKHVCENGRLLDAVQFSGD